LAEKDPEKIRQGVIEYMNKKGTYKPNTIEKVTFNIKTIIARYGVTIPSEELAKYVEEDMIASNRAETTVRLTKLAIYTWAEACGTPIKLNGKDQMRIILPQEAIDTLTRIEEYLTIERKPRLARTTIANIMRNIKGIMRAYNVLVPSIKLAIQVEKDLDEKGRSPATIRHSLFALEYWADAMKVELKLSNPKSDSQRIDFLKSEEIQKLLEEGAKNWRDKAILYLMTYGGLRDKELINAEVADLDLTNKQLIIKSKHGVDVKSKGIKNKMEDVVMLSDEAVEVLSEYIKRRPFCENTPALFVSIRKKRLSIKGLQYIVDGCSKRAGIRHVYPYLLRHTCATQMLENGKDVVYVQKHLRHKRLEQTLTYAHPTDEMMHKIVKDMKFY
jgi:site-specific recombinase XerD